MRSPRIPNQVLRALLAEAGWSGAQLAREVNSLGIAQGTPFHYDRTSVAHWLSGSCPRPPVPSLVAEALSRRLGRVVRTEDTGLMVSEPPGYVPEVSPAEESAVEYLRRVLPTTDQRGHTQLGAYSLAALAAPGWQAEAEHPSEAGEGIRTGVDVPHTESARELLSVFARSDAAFGSGAIREPLRQYLSATVLPLLESEMRPAVRRELFTVAARLAYLCAFAHFDMNHQAAAQSFYLSSIRLAREAGDRVGYALGMRGLSVQAHALGHLTQAHHLAEQAVRIGASHAPPHQRAFLLGQLALSQAARGDAHHARSFAAAERCLERASSGATPVGAFHPGSLAYQQAAASTARGDHRTALRALELSLRHRPAEERRSQALCLAECAETQLTIGHLEQACATWHEFLDLYPSLASARADDRLRTLIARTRPNSANPVAGALLGRALEQRRNTRAADG
ncbi:hypothetical protein [Streptomyces sp. NPDC001401]|uniref:hypothetical protein n=1 Tax=Streptomyces sp. NPDC001401 TaxID=3364570 RepID=UPI0036833555